jgi:hypothetical protein
VTKLVATAIPELAADVKPASVRLGWFGPIVLEDVAIVPRNGDRTPLEVHRVEVEHGLAGILLSAGNLGRVRIEGLRADVVFDKEHRTNLDSILPPREPGQAPRGKGPRRAAIALQLDVEDAVVRISGPWTSDPWVSEPIDVKAALANGADGYAAWTIEPVQLLKHAELQQTVAREVLAYIVPVFADAARTSGRFSLRLDGATFPVGRPNEAKLAGLLQMHEVVLGPGPLVENMFRSLPMNLPPPPTIRITDEADVAFHLAERRMWHEGLEFGIPLKKSGQRLDVRSQGSVGLDDRSLDLKLSLPIPADLPQDRPLVAALAGKQVSLGVGGVLGEPKVIFDGSIKEAAGQVVVDLIDRWRNGPRLQPPANAPASRSWNAPQELGPQRRALPRRSPAGRPLAHRFHGRGALRQPMQRPARPSPPLRRMHRLEMPVLRPPPRRLVRRPRRWRPTLPRKQGRAPRLPTPSPISSGECSMRWRDAEQSDGPPRLRTPSRHRPAAAASCSGDHSLPSRSRRPPPCRRRHRLRPAPRLRSERPGVSGLT